MLRSFTIAIVLAAFSVPAMADEPVTEPNDVITAGPKDPKERTKPGKIDEDAPREFKTTESGLKYRILRKSDKIKPKAFNKVQVHYKGWLDDKSIFDSSYQRGEKISFPLTAVIPGWTEGMQLVGEGGMIELEIPGKLGYGKRGTRGIPPDATLHFIVELFRVR
ncbi:MAG: FKBP-type peptidyl-prolyl cis-trans isomerase [Rubripirellula sp.]